MTFAELVDIVDPIYVTSTLKAQALILYGATMDSRKVDPGDIFFSLEAKAPTPSGDVPKDDRPRFIASAIESGAQVVVFEPGLNLDDLPVDDYARSKVIFVQVANPELAFAQVAFRFIQKRPHHIAAVTGTNGKTSTVSILRDIWRAVGRDAYSLGTLGLISDEPHNCLVTGLTTPQPDAFCKLLKAVAEKHTRSYLAVEASSQGLNEERLSSVEVDVAAFSNLTRDHLNYHSYNRKKRTMDDDLGAFERYAECKRMLFLDRLKKEGVAVVNIDDRYGVDLITSISAQRPDVQILTCSCEHATADFFVASATQSDVGVELTMHHGPEVVAIAMPLYGAFQRYNAVLAVGMAVASGVSFGEAVAALGRVRPVRGRMEFVGETNTCGRVYVDYAHTDDALRSILTGAREAFPGRPISIVFGAGGDRDVGKRPRMGRVAGELADQIFVTDDNPRSEDPGIIRAQVMGGIVEAGAERRAASVAPRDVAISQAVSNLPKAGILLIAGKGHEDYQDIKGKKFPFDDVVVALRALQRR
ncbi:Mur ligase family protein [Pleomorphomonas sp. PLEO]|uniref:Mur ligase family protein n=1 Tax=Pleomorphomonas sp. PLEO TaxID=3239306 RepID=UPI00351F66B4